MSGFQRLNVRGRLPLLEAALSVIIIGVMTAGSPGLASGAEARKYVVRTKGLSVELTGAGRVAGLVIGPARLRKAVTGGTELAACETVGKTIVRTKPGGAIEFEKTLKNKTGDSCRLIERFSPAPDSIRWEIEVLGSGKPWTTAIETRLQYPDAAKARFWSPWGDSRQGAFAKMEKSAQEAGGLVPAVAVGDWSDPLVPMAFTDATLSFGAPAFRYEDPGLAFIPSQAELFCIPLATILESGPDLGISLALSPENPYLELALTTRSDGGIVFARSNHRIQDKAPLKFAADLIVHEADWRGGMRWMASRYPEYFDPTVPGTEELAGTAAYSAHEGYLDSERLRRMAFRTNWKASWDFPYPGMFLPPVETGTFWPRFAGGATSIPWIRDYIRSMRSKGFFVLNYFNVTEFGAWIVYPPPSKPEFQGDDLWRGANDYLYGKLAGAILYVPGRTRLEGQRAYKQTKVDGPYYTWLGGVVLDPGEPVYRDFLLDQARRHVREFPESSGICIDRMDWLRMYNERRDDGVSWFEGLPVRSLYTSWRDLLEKLGPIMHEAGKAIFINNHTKRIDLSKFTDAYYDEFTYKGVSLNLTALLAIRKTALGWVDSAADLAQGFDAFFQKHIYMGIYPMVPYPLNDHSIEPGILVDRQYLDYGPLMDAIRGKKWVLAPHAVSVEGGAAKANVFEVAGGWVVPVVFGGGRTSVRITLRVPPDLAGLKTARALHPGSEEWAPVTVSGQGAALTLDVPLVRGCAIVRLDRPVK
jgi:hypothetical protein